MRSSAWFCFVTMAFMCIQGIVLWRLSDWKKTGIVLLVVCAVLVLAWMTISAVSIVNVSKVQKGNTCTHSTSDLINIMTNGGSREWITLAKTDNSFDSDCRGSTATYTKLAKGGVGVNNICFSRAGAVRDIRGTVHSTNMKGVLRISFFPGIVAQFIVRVCNTRYLIVTNSTRTKGWLLHATDDKTATLEEKQQWLNEFERAVVKKVSVTDSFITSTVAAKIYNAA